MVNIIPGFGLMKRAWLFVRWCYFQFAIHTCVSMLEPVEERVLAVVMNVWNMVTESANEEKKSTTWHISLLVAILLMVSYVTITYLPGHLIMLFSFTRHILGV